jgi:hypothetical protein
MVPNFIKNASDGLYNKIDRVVTSKKESFENGKKVTNPAKNKKGPAKVIWVLILIFLFLIFTAPMFYAWYILFKCNKHFDQQMLTEGLILWFLGGLWITNIVYIYKKTCDNIKKK